MRKEILTVTAAAMLALVAGNTAIAHDHRGFGAHGDDPARMAEHLTRWLELEQDQAQTVRNIAEAAVPEIESVRERARANREALRSLDPNDPGYDAELNRLADENGYLAAEATRLHGRLRAELHAVLTPEQQQQLSDATERMHGRSGRRHRTHDESDTR